MAPLRFGLCPNGYCFGFAATLAISAMVLSVLATFSCHYLTRRGLATDLLHVNLEDTLTILRNPNDTLQVSVGLWFVEEVIVVMPEDENTLTTTAAVTGNCVLWDAEAVEEDTALNVAQWVSAVTSGASCIVFLFIAAIAVVRLPQSLLRHTYHCLGCGFIGLTVAMALTLVVLASNGCQENNGDCQLDWAGYCAITASGVWCVAAVTLCCCTPIRHRERNESHKNINDTQVDEDDNEENSQDDPTDPADHDNHDETHNEEETGDYSSREPKEETREDSREIALPIATNDNDDNVAAEIVEDESADRSLQPQKRNVISMMMCTDLTELCA